MSDPADAIAEFRAALPGCKTIPAVERLQDDTWARLLRTDAANNTLVLQEAHARKMELKPEKAVRNDAD